MNEKPKEPKLLDQLRNKIRLKNYSIRTEKTYVDWNKRYILFHKKRHPREMGAREVEEFLTHLAVEKNVSASTQNQALSAILFLYKEVLGIELPWLENVQRAKKPERLPVVFTKTEVNALLARLEGVHWLMANILYGTGLRLMECVRLRIEDIDFEYGQIVVREGKGQKDRITMLPNSIRTELQRHLDRVRLIHETDLSQGFGEVYLPYVLERKYPGAGKEWGWQYVFPAGNRSVDPRSGKIRRHHLDEKRNVSITLRHP
jgi:integron integrase